MENAKCSICKTYLNELEGKRNGGYYKTCKRCRETQKLFYKKRGGNIEQQNIPQNIPQNMEQQNINKIKKRGEVVIIDGVKYEITARRINRGLCKEIIPNYDEIYRTIKLEELPEIVIIYDMERLITDEIREEYNLKMKTIEDEYEITISE